MPNIILEFFCRGALFLIVTLNKNIKLIVNYVAGPLIMLLLFYAVIRQLEKQPHWRDYLQQMLSVAAGHQRMKFFAMVGLMGVNWALESYKWQIALKPVQTIRFGQAFKGILAGTCVASFTPNRVGEYLGRMLIVDPGNKLKSVASSVLCSMSQTLITLMAGSLGIYLFSRLPFQASWMNSSLLKFAGWGTALGAVGLGLVYFRFDPLVGRINVLLKKNKKAFVIPDHFELSILWQVLFLSTLRYTVFLLQYYLLFSVFGISLDAVQVFTGVSVMFVLMAIVPTLTFLTDLGFRWFAGILIFQVYTPNTAGILAVSLGIWLINLIIPALVGSLLILRIKLFQSR